MFSKSTEIESEIDYSSKTLQLVNILKDFSKNYQHGANSIVTLYQNYTEIARTIVSQINLLNTIDTNLNNSIHSERSQSNNNSNNNNNNNNDNNNTKKNGILQHNNNDNY